MNAELLAMSSNFGLILFTCLYIYASTLYDGGSKLHPHRKSWDWINNYWCDLIWPTTILEQPNRAFKWGVVANSILCISTALFFISFSLVFAPGGYWAYIIGVSGTIAMICAMLIFSKWHDKIIGAIILSVLPAVTGVVYGLIYFDKKMALYWGAVSLVFIIANVYIFYTKKGERYLPFIQKIAFGVVLCWIYIMNTSI